MKKKGNKYRNFLRRRVLNKFRHELKRKMRRKNLRILKIPERNKKRTNIKIAKHPELIKFEQCKAPENFSLIEDPELVISYFEKAKRALKKNVPVHLDLSEVTNMGPETLTYLCALINDENFTNKNFIKGTSPKNELLKNMFLKAGFYQYVKPRIPVYQEDKDIEDKLIHRISREKVKPKLANDVCVSALNHTNVQNILLKRKLFTTLIECMANTWNHARGEKLDDIYNWWLLAYKEQDTKITKFCFLDMGVGIFDSINTKLKNNTLADWLKNLVVPTDNRETLRSIFSGSNLTSTKLPERGLGLINIYKNVKQNINIKNFTLIANDIVAKIGYNTIDEIKQIESNLKGTLYYWELVPNN